MVVVIDIKIANQPFFLLYRCSVLFVLSSNSLHQNTRPINRPRSIVDGPSILKDGVRGQEEYHNKQNKRHGRKQRPVCNLTLHLLQSFAAACGGGKSEIFG